LEAGVSDTTEKNTMSKLKLALAATLVLSAGAPAVGNPHRPPADCHEIQMHTTGKSTSGEQAYFRHVFESDIVTLGSRGISRDRHDDIGAQMLHPSVPEKC
jgi:hypothetical protein